MSSREQVGRSYNEIAEIYHTIRSKKGGWFFNELLEMPNTLKLLGNVKGKNILDLGCGTGIYAKTLKKRGAKVKGIDISEEMVRIARRENPDVEFRIGNVEKLPYNKGEFDIVLAALCLGHLDNWDNVFKEVRRVLKPHGVFVFSIDNPVINSVKKAIFEGTKLNSNAIVNSVKKASGKNKFVLPNYFHQGLKISKWFVMKENQKKYTIMINYHKTYGTIVKVIVRNGFEIVDYEDSYPFESAKKVIP